MEWKGEKKKREEKKIKKYHNKKGGVKERWVGRFKRKGGRDSEGDWSNREDRDKGIKKIRKRSEKGKKCYG